MRAPASALALLFACGSPPEPTPSNLIVIVVDTLRADHLGLHGYDRDTSPFLDEIARQGVVFENAQSVSSFTRESVSALLTGHLPSTSGSIGWYAAPAEHLPTLGTAYAQAGYRTGFFTTTLMLPDPGYARGFESVEHLVKKGGVSGKGQALSERALEFVRECDDDPFMMYLHYFDPHGPYDPPEELKRRFTDEIHPDPVGLYTQLRKRVPEYVSKGFGPGDPLYEDQQVRYDAEITWTDQALKSLFDGLAELGVDENTLVVITSDHGEEFLEHGFVEHAWTLYQESLHVPLILWWPAVLKPARAPERVSLVDVLPTVQRLQGLESTGPSDGHCLIDLEGQPLTLRTPVLGELLIQHRNVLRSVTVGRWKYIQARQWLNPRQRSEVARSERKHELEALEVDFDPWGPVVREELYNLVSDPRETRNLKKSEPELFEQLQVVMQLFEKRAREMSPEQGGRGEAPELDQAMLDALKAIGY
jgi:arylsulfatase